MVDHLEEGWNIFPLIWAVPADLPPRNRGWARSGIGERRTASSESLFARAGTTRYVLILGGTMFTKWIHGVSRVPREAGCRVSVALLEVDRSQASEFGIAEVTMIFALWPGRETPEPKAIPDDPERSLPRWASICSGQNASQTPQGYRLRTILEGYHSSFNQRAQGHGLSVQR